MEPKNPGFCSANLVFAVCAILLSTRPSSAQPNTIEIKFKANNLPQIPPIAEDIKVKKEIFNFKTGALLAGTPLMYYIKTITPADGNFEFTPDEGILSTRVNAKFDFETTEKYDVTVVATDGLKVKSAEISITVNIIDVNEAPYHDKLPATILYPENFPLDPAPITPWRVIYTVTGKDPDVSTKTAAWKTLKYKMGIVLPKSHSNPPAADVFDLDIKTGELRMKQSPNHEEYSQYRFNIWIEDGGGLKSDVRTLNLDISDVNESPWFNVSNPPYYNMYHSAETYSCEIWEESPIGMQLPIPPITAYDEDVNDILTYQLEGRDHIYFEIKTINGSGYIYIAKRIDFESRDINLFKRQGSFTQTTYFTVTLIVSAVDKRLLRTLDTDEPPNELKGKASRLEVKVQVYDINDHLPECNPTYYTATIKENTPVDTSILTISCSDLDYDKRIAYTVNGSDVANRYFWVKTEGLGGTLKTKGPADIESDVSVLFYVYAYQGLYPKRTSANVTVLIHITAENDNRPVFDKEFYNFEVAYDAPQGHPVGRINASDYDVLTQAILSYHWVSTNTLFKMAAHDGIISTLKALENGRKYIYYAHAKDNGSPPKYSEHIAVRIDTFSGKSFLVDFVVAQPRSYFTAATVKDFLAAISSACPPCVGRLTSMKPTPGSEASATTLSVHILKDGATESYSNIDEPKYLLSAAEILDIFAVNSAGQPSVAVSTLEFHRFPVIKVLPHDALGLTALEWLLTTPGGKAVIALLSILGIILFLVGLVYLLKFLIPLCKLIRCAKCNCPKMNCDCCKRPEKPPPIEKHIHHPDGDVNVMDFRYTDAPLVAKKLLKPTTS